MSQVNNAVPSVQPVRRVAFLCTGRVNPAVSATMGFFIKRYRESNPDVTLCAYKNGYRGLMKGDVMIFGEKEYDVAPLLLNKGGSPIGGSRVRLHNTQHLVREGLIQSAEEDPIAQCAQVLKRDQIDVLHVIGSTTSQLQAKAISDYLRSSHLNYTLTVVGVPKTLENDMGPIRRTLGCNSGAQGGARFFNNVVAEHHANPRMLIIHEIKGRAAGWLAAATAFAYRQNYVQKGAFAPALGLSKDSYDVHAVYTPEMKIDWSSEFTRLKRCMDRNDNVNIFVAQGCFTKEIEESLAAQGKDPKRHPKIGYVQTEPAAWLAAKLKAPLEAEKVLVQKSGVYVRAQTATREDLVLAQSLVNAAVSQAQRRKNGVMGHDDNQAGRLRCIPHTELRSGTWFDLTTPWFVEMLAQIGQPQPVAGASRRPFVYPSSKL